MKVLLHHTVPYPVTDFLQKHDLATADEMGWAKLNNGKLLEAAERAGFQVFITADKHLSYQQNRTGRQLALVVLSTNNWALLKQNIPAITKAINFAQHGSFTYVDI